MSLEEFRTEATGGWLFNYVEALRSAGLRTVLVLVSSAVSAPTRTEHVPTGTTIWILPSPRVYRLLRKRLVRPYSPSVRAAFGGVHGSRQLLLPLLALAKEAAPYLSTPLRSLVRVLRQEGCGGIVCQEYEFPRFDVCVALGRLLAVPVFATFQGGAKQHGHLERLLRPAAIRGCAGLIIGPDREVERVQRRYSPPDSKIARVANPVDRDAMERFDRAAARTALGLPDDGRIAVWHGRISIHHKGLDLLLDAWERVCHARPDRDLKLVLVGSGKDGGRLRRELQRRALRGVVWRDEYVRDRRTLRLYLSAADVYVFPSRHEGFPVAPLEAMACGLPLVAAAAEGIDEILDGGEGAGGVVVPQEDPAALASALGSLLDDPVRAHAMGVRARNRVEALFTAEAIGAQLRSFLSRRGLDSGTPGATRSP